MDDFLTSHFKEHGQFYPKLVSLLFETSVSRTELAQLQTAADDASTSVRAVTTAVGNGKNAHDRLVTRVHTLENRR